MVICALLAVLLVESASSLPTDHSKTQPRDFECPHAIYQISLVGEPLSRFTLRGIDPASFDVLLGGSPGGPTRWCIPNGCFSAIIEAGARAARFTLASLTDGTARACDAVVPGAVGRCEVCIAGGIFVDPRELTAMPPLLPPPPPLPPNSRSTGMAPPSTPCARRETSVWISLDGDRW